MDPAFLCPAAPIMNGRELGHSTSFTFTSINIYNLLTTLCHLYAFLE